MRKYFKLFLFFMIIILSPKVFAAEMNVSNKVRATYNGTAGTYYGLENYLYGQSSTYSIGTRYNGRLSKIDFFLNSSDWDWDYNTTYTVTLNMATEDWRNQFMQINAFMTNDSGVVSSSYNNLYVANTFRFVSYKKIKFDIRLNDVMLSKIKFTLWSGGNSYFFTGVNNWNLSSITIADQVTVLPTPIPNQPTPTPIPDSSQAIIDNQTQNTQDIIDNNTQNTSDIIENNNQNTEKIVDTIEQKCSNLLNHKNTSALSGVSQSNITFSDNSITFKGNNNSTASNYVAYYIDVNKFTDYYLSVSNNPNLIYVFSPTYQTISVLQNGQTSTTFNTELNDRIYILFYANGQNNTVYSDIMLSSDNKPYCQFGTSSNRLDDTTNAINNLNDSINNDQIDDKTGFFTNFQDNNHGLTSIITAPLTTIQSLANTSCAALSVPIPFTNSNVNLPCMTEVYEDYVPTVFNLWQIVSFGIISYFICIDIFKMVKGFKDPNEDKVEVLDL